jgi:hypothetical protein
MGAAIGEWCVYIMKGKVYAGVLDFIGTELDSYKIPRYVVERFYGDDDHDNKLQAQSLAYKVSKQAGIPISFSEEEA